MRVTVDIKRIPTNDCRLKTATKIIPLCYVTTVVEVQLIVTEISIIELLNS